jgi:hypothetical protein
MRVLVVLADSVDQGRKPVGRTTDLVGIVAALQRDSLVLKLDDVSKLTTFPISHITQISQSAGTTRHIATGALIGGAAGLALGALAIRDGQSSCSGNLCDNPLATSTVREGKAAVVVLLGALGAGIGALIGAVPDEQWTPLPDQRVGTMIVPTRGGVALNLSVRW